MTRDREFNVIFCEVIDEVITELLGPSVLGSLYTALKTHHDISRDELPYRLETVNSVLKQTFGIQSTNIIGMRVAHRLYKKLNLALVTQSGFNLIDYIKMAKSMLQESKES
jgi:hypothetical protein